MMNIITYINEAIANGKEITIKYQKYDGTLSTRTISNIQYSDEYGNDYISGFCHLRQETRTFKISRIQEIDGISTQTITATISKKTYTQKKIYTPYKPSETKTKNISSSLQSVCTPEPTKPKPISNTEGCYIATMVYGDYNHPQVLILRKFRDQELLTTNAGIAFVKLYYWLSPKLVRILKDKNLINLLIRRTLDKLIFKIENSHRSKRKKS